MTSRNPVPTTVIACAAMALAALASAAALGYPRVGFAFAAGLLLGSLNGVLIQRSLRATMPFQATSLSRLALLSVVAVGLGLVIDHEVVWPLLGLAVAQLILAGVSAYTLVRR